MGRKKDKTGTRGGNTADSQKRAVGIPIRMVIFPHSTIPIVAPFDEQLFSKLQQGAPLVFIPEMPSGRQFHVGVLGTTSNFRRKDPSGELHFDFTGERRVRVYKSKKIPFGYSRRPDVPVPPEIEIDPAFRELFPILAHGFLEIVEQTKRAAKGDPDQEQILKQPFMQQAVLCVRDLTSKNLAVALDSIMNVLNHLSFIVGGQPINIFGPSLMILKEEDVSLRFVAVASLVKSLLAVIVPPARRTIPDPQEYTGDDGGDEDNGHYSRAASSAKDPLWREYQREKGKIPKHAQIEIEREFQRLQQKGSSSDTVAATDRIRWLLDLFTLQDTPDRSDLKEAHRILEKGHYGLEKPKERILEFLAIRKHAPKGGSNILCFVGPPGVGKTSLGRSVADALGKKFVRFSLGGLRDEGAIRGHEMIYIRTHPGQIVRHMIKAGSSNPVFMLDEVDKISRDWRGDPTSALLEVLDPEENKEFEDIYIGVPCDLSRVFFICTANSVDTIPPALRDRMEIIKIAGYTAEEKIEIAKRHLLPRLRARLGYPLVRDKDQRCFDLHFSDNAIIGLIEGYTRETGVRQLDRKLEGIHRKFAKAVELEEIKDAITLPVTYENLRQWADKPLEFTEEQFGSLPVGAVPMFAVSEHGGYFFCLEARFEKGRHQRKIKVTGVRGSGEAKEQINNLIEETLDTALDGLILEGGMLYKSPQEREKEGEFYVHVHVRGDSSTPKDGPSAGIPADWVLTSLFENEPIQPHLGATGEIDLRLGILIAVGGIREKVLAARRAGFKRFIVPKGNESDLDDIPEEIKKEIEFLPVRYIWEARLIAFPNNPRVKEYAEAQRRTLNNEEGGS